MAFDVRINGEHAKIVLSGDVDLQISQKSFLQGSPSHGEQSGLCGILHHAARASGT